MTQTLESPGPRAGIEPPPVPPEFAELMWPELPSVIDEVIEEIRATIPEYARPADSAYDQIVRLGADKILRGFIEHIADPSRPLTERDDTCRALGYFEALEGRSLDCLNTAYRIALHIAWRRVAVVARRESLPSDMVTSMAESMIVYMDEAAMQAVHGHQQAREQEDLQRRDARRHLLEAILTRPAPSHRTIAHLAEAAAWPLPDLVTLVAVRPGAEYTLSGLDHDVLADLEAPRPYILLPGGMDKRRRFMLETTLGDIDSVVGVSVPVEKAVDSLRWARRVLDLAATGIVTGRPLMDCESHLMTVWLTADTALVDYLAGKHLAPLSNVSDHMRKRLTETLREWVTTKGTAVEIGERLHVHPQTVRYRMRQLDAYLGDSLDTPQARFSVEVTLRAAHLLNRRTRPLPNPPE